MDMFGDILNPTTTTIDATITNNHKTDTITNTDAPST